MAGWINDEVKEDDRLQRRQAIRVMRRTLVAGRLQRLFLAVERGDLSVEEATSAAMSDISVTEGPAVVGALSPMMYETLHAVQNDVPVRYDPEQLMNDLSRVIEESGPGLHLTEQPVTSLSDPGLTFAEGPARQDGPRRHLPPSGVFLHRAWNARDEVRRLLLRPRSDGHPAQPR